MHEWIVFQVMVSVQETIKLNKTLVDVANKWILEEGAPPLTVVTVSCRLFFSQAVKELLLPVKVPRGKYRLWRHSASSAPHCADDANLLSKYILMTTTKIADALESFERNTEIFRLHS